jgi:hypothetical protein
MNSTLEFQSLTLDELMVIDGGRITADTSFAYDLAYLTGLFVRGYYEFVTAAASFQSSLPPNLKK